MHHKERSFLFLADIWFSESKVWGSSWAHPNCEQWSIQPHRRVTGDHTEKLWPQSKKKGEQKGPVSFHSEGTYIRFHFNDITMTWSETFILNWTSKHIERAWWVGLISPLFFSFQLFTFLSCFCFLLTPSFSFSSYLHFSTSQRCLSHLFPLYFHDDDPLPLKHNQVRHHYGSTGVCRPVPTDFC